MIVLATIGFLPVSFASALTIGHYLGLGWEVGSIPLLACLGVWYGLITARSK